MKHFFKLGAESLLYVNQGKIKGLIRKNDVESLMSDLSFSLNMKEPPYKPVDNLEILLDENQSHGIVINKEKVIPAINSRLEIIGNWNREQIIKSWGQIPDVKDWQIPRVSVHTKTKNIPQEPDLRESDIYKENNYTEDFSEYKLKLKTKPPQITIKNIKQENENSLSDQSSKIISKKRTDNINPEKLSMAALETLPIPMLAMNTRGDVLFYNGDWEELQKQHTELNEKDLYQETRNKMGNLAIEGKLDLDSIIPIFHFRQNKVIEMKTLFNNSDSNKKALGYLFWISNADEPDNKVSPEPGVKEKENSSDQVTDSDYSNQTWKEIMEAKEKSVIQWALEQSGDSLTNAAMLLGMPRQTFSFHYYKLFKKGKETNKHH